jgi:hypothetical protein
MQPDRLSDAAAIAAILRQRGNTEDRDILDRDIFDRDIFDTTLPIAYPVSP